ncbi:MAG: sugar ABC transporter ATP-binding protein [Deltaproteobacteria bacterium]|nr:sugar ABC transporter ATP-binding protein [Deltaproteobacteria bacterium]MBW2444581.1 sugar ABC transporter ATP-binding protein [Deltaproteobacteria bacterium]
MSEPLLELRGVTKTFGGVHAVETMDLGLVAGEVHGLLGHNGAGKSTLMKLLSGVHRIDAGEIRLAGAAIELRSPRDAQRHGIEMIYQDLALADNLDSVANLFLGRELRTRLGLLDEGAMERRATELLGDLNPDFHQLREPVGRLSGGQRQMVAIARALLFDARILVMDEPTAALGPAESQNVSALIRRLAERGIAIVLVSHDLHDVFDLSDRITVMKNGRLVATAPRSELDPDRVLELIIAGR